MEIDREKLRVILSRNKIVRIHCPSKDDAIQLLKMLKDWGYEWNGSKEDLIDNNKWDVFRDRTYYTIDARTRRILLGDVSYADEDISELKDIFDSIEPEEVPADAITKAFSVAKYFYEDMSTSDLNNVFSQTSHKDVTASFSPEQVYQKVIDFKESKSADLGDIILVATSGNIRKVIITKKTSYGYIGMNERGNFLIVNFSEAFKKVGHIDLTNIFNKLKEDF